MVNVLVAAPVAGSVPANAQTLRALSRLTIWQANAVEFPHS